MTTESTRQSTELPPFVAPGPGSWELDRSHLSRPVAHFISDFWPDAFTRGMRSAFSRYGAPINGLQAALINGFVYHRVMPAPEAEFPARIEAAAETFATKRWRADLQRWDTEVKPRNIARHRELQAIDPATLDDDGLLAHLAVCRDHFAEMAETHHSFNSAAMTPVGDLIAHMSAWAPEVSTSEVLALLQGASPVSSGLADEMAALLDAIARDDTARALVNRDDPAALQELCALPGAAGAAAREYVDMVGYRLLDSVEPGYPYALEQPEILLRGIRAALDADSRAVDDAESTKAATDRVREAVPAEHRAEFDELLAEARLLYRLRDERGLYCDVWSAGIVRRVVLAVGARLAMRGALLATEHAMDATYDELCAMLRGTGGPSAAEVATRAHWRATAHADDVPIHLGDPPAPPPPLELLPPPMARATAAVQTVIMNMFAEVEHVHTAESITGIAASNGSYEGTVRLVRSPADFGRIEPGDVLLTSCTTEAFNIILPLLGAIVTDRGGLLSHPAIVAREYGIPAVVGTREASRLIADGTRVRVNGTTGEVLVLE